MLYALSGDNTRRKINDSIAWWDICPVPGPNNCGGDHNLPELQLLSTEVLIQFMKKCPNLKKILFFGKNPNIYSMEQFLSQLEKRAPELLSAFHPTFRLGSPDFKSPCQYNPHSQFFLMHLNTKEHTMDYMRVGVDVINTVFKIDFTQQLMELDDAIVQEIIPFATKAVIEARRLVMSQVMKDHWANPEGPFRNVSELMKAHWANPDGPYRNHSQNMINFHNAMYSHRTPCPRCGILIRGSHVTGMASHLKACQGQTIISYIDELKSLFGGNLPHKNDVIVRQGAGIQTLINQWKGNSDFKVLISDASSSYHTSALCSEKSEIINAIMNKIKKNNGQFVVYNIDKNIWKQQPEKNSRAKITKSLKEHSNL